MTNVVKGGNTNNLTKVIIEALEKHASVSNVDVVTKLMSFEVNGVNVFQGVCHNGVTQQIKNKFALHLEGIHFSTLHEFNYANLVSTSCNETHRGLASICFFFFFFHNQKWDPEFLKLVINLMKARGTKFWRMWKDVGPTWLVQQNGCCLCTCVHAYKNGWK